MRDDEAARREHIRRWVRPDFERFLRPDWERYVHPAGHEAVRRHIAECKAAFEPPPRADERLRDAQIERERLREEKAALEREQAWETECAARKLKADLAWERFTTTLARYLAQQRLARKYSPDQPRVPAGSSEGGQWTSGGGSQGGEDRLGQSDRPAPDQSPRSDLAELEAIANHPNIRPRIEDAWKASNPYTLFPREQGFWILRSAETGELYTRPFAGPALRDAIVPGPVPSDAIASFHTHPVRGVISRPSAADLIFAGRAGLPGLIQSHDGMYYFGPALNSSKPR
jgi:hypothetical protein